MYFIGNNKLFCNGRLIFGAKPSSSLLTMLVINIPALLFSIFTAKVRRFTSLIQCNQFYLNEESISWKVAIFILWYFQLATNVFLFKVSTTDPGIIPARQWEHGTLPIKYVKNN